VFYGDLLRGYGWDEQLIGGIVQEFTSRRLYPTGIRYQPQQRVRIEQDLTWLQVS
jgi:hypothetical protein